MSMRLRFVAVAVATIVVIVAWFTLLYRPGSARLKEVRAQIDTTESEIATLQTKLAQLQELQRNEKVLREQAAKYARALPALPELSTYIRQVQQVADDSDIDWVSVSPSTPAAPGAGAPGAAAGGAPAAGAPATGALRTIGVQLTARGGFFEIEDFVERFERLDRAVRINNFTLSGGEGGRLSLTLTVVMYMGGTTPQSLAASPPAAGPGAAASPAPGASPSTVQPGTGAPDRTSQGINVPDQ